MFDNFSLQALCLENVYTAFAALAETAPDQIVHWPQQYGHVLFCFSETFLKNPFKHAIFINDIHIWLQSLDAASLRGKAQKYGFFTDLARIDRLALTERNHGNEPHNRELLAIIMAQERDGYINLCKMVKEFGLYTTRLEQMNSLLTESDQV